jgi:hypothetical protein
MFALIINDDPASDLLHLFSALRLFSSAAPAGLVRVLVYAPAWKTIARAWRQFRGETSVSISRSQNVIVVLQ